MRDAPTQRVLLRRLRWSHATLMGLVLFVFCAVIALRACESNLLEVTPVSQPVGEQT